MLVLTAAYIVLLVIPGIGRIRWHCSRRRDITFRISWRLLLSWGRRISRNAALHDEDIRVSPTGVLAAFINASSLVLIALVIFYEAVERFYNPVAGEAGADDGGGGVGRGV